MEPTAPGSSGGAATRAPGARAPWRWTQRQPWRNILTSIAVVCMALAFFESVAGILPDGTLFWLITPVRAVLIVGLVAMALVVPHPSAWRTWLDIPLLVLVLTSLVASFGRTDSMAAWRWLLTEVALYYLVVMVRRQHRDGHRAALIFVLVGIATPALIALQQAAAQTPTGFCRSPGQGMADGCEQPGALVRVIGTMTNPNLLAAFLLLFLPLAWLAVDEWLNSAARLAGYVLLALGYLALLQTWSRAGLAAGVLGIVALFTLARPIGRRLRIGGALLAVGLVAAVGMAVVSGAGVRTRLWTAALSLAVHHPLGVGLGRSGTLLTQAIPNSLQFQHAHNTWLNWLVEAGWLGFLAVMAITVLVCWRVWRSTAEGSRIAAALGAGLLGFGLMSLTDHPANALRIALALAFAIGLVMTSSVADQRILARPSVPVAGRPGQPEPVAGPEPVAAPVPAVPSFPEPDRGAVGAGDTTVGGWDPYTPVGSQGWGEPAPAVEPARVEPTRAEPARVETPAPVPTYASAWRGVPVPRSESVEPPPPTPDRVPWARPDGDPNPWARRGADADDTTEDDAPRIGRGSRWRG